MNSSWDPEIYVCRAKKFGYRMTVSCGLDGFGAVGCYPNAQGYKIIDTDDLVARTVTGFGPWHTITSHGDSPRYVDATVTW